MSKSRQDNELQAELPLSSVLAHTLFPGRAMLLVAEIATAFRCTEQHVLNLCEMGDLISIDIRTGKPSKPSEHIASRAARRCLRIPVSSYDHFIGQAAVKTHTS